MEYIVDGWQFLKITGDGISTIHIFASFSGGYLDSDHWRRSSPIQKIEKDGNKYVAITASGNRYIFFADSNHINAYNSQVLKNKHQLTYMYYDLEYITLEEAIKFIEDNK